MLLKGQASTEVLDALMKGNKAFETLSQQRNDLDDNIIKMLLASAGPITCCAAETLPMGMEVAKKELLEINEKHQLGLLEDTPKMRQRLEEW